MNTPVSSVKSSATRHATTKIKGGHPHLRRQPPKLGGNLKLGRNLGKSAQPAKHKSPSQIADLPRIIIPPPGGLNHSERFLHLRRDSDRLDPLLVSLNLEVSERQRLKALSSNHAPVIREYGVAILDPREIRGCTDKKGLRRLITTQHYQRDLAGKPDPTAPPIGGCAFSHTNTVIESNFASVITSSLRVKDAKVTDGSTRFRNLAIVGHSLDGDLRILQQRGIDIGSIAPRVVFLDTHQMARAVLGPKSTRLGRHAPVNNFSLSAVLTELGFPHTADELHNAGNKATYTLFALLGLAVTSSQARRLDYAQFLRLKQLEHLVPNRAEKPQLDYTQLLRLKQLQHMVPARAKTPELDYAQMLGVLKKLEHLVPTRAKKPNERL